MSNPRKILVLHGYTQNATLFQRWISPIEAACADDNMEFVFVDGPVLLRQEDIWPGYTPPPDLPLNVKVPETQDDPALIPKAWWRTYPDVNETTGIERTITKLRDTLQNDHFEGVLGFSQGSTLAVMLCALLEKPDIYPHFLVDGKAPHPPLKFCVAVTGYLPECPFLTSLFSSPSKTPTLHIRGRADDLSPESVQQALVDVSSVNRKYVSHGKAHIVPTESGWPQFFREYFNDPTRAHLSLPEDGDFVKSQPVVRATKRLRGFVFSLAQRATKPVFARITAFLSWIGSGRSRQRELLPIAMVQRH